MRYPSLFAAAAVLVTLAACKGNDSGMSADLAKDLASAKTNDALALAPHVGMQTVVSAEELSPQGRSRVAPSRRSTRTVAHRTPHRDRVATPTTTDIASTGPAPSVSASAPSPEPTVMVSAPSPRPQPVDVSYPSTGSSSGRGEGNGSGGGVGGIGGIIGAIGGAILRGGVVGGDGDHCDPRSNRGGGGILINRRGPILRGNF